MAESDDIQHRQYLADYAWGFCQSMGVKNLDIPTDKGSKVTLVELLVEYRQEAMRNLASGMRKVMTPEQLEDLAYTCDPLGSFIIELRKSGE